MAEDFRYKLNRSRKNLRRDVGRAIADFTMIEDGDLVMVCLSGGKDSYTLLDILLNLQQHAPIDFRIHAVNLDQKQPGFPEEVLPRFLKEKGVDYTILEQDTYSIVTDKIAEDKTYCGLCSRLRRGILYNFAESIGAQKIALGHHRDDIVETLFLNMFHGGKLKAMPPKLRSDDGRNVVIRPLAYCKEKAIERYAELAGFPIIPCNLCGSQDNLQRQAIKQMLHTWNKEHPGRVESIFRAIANVSPSQLADSSLFNFAALRGSNPRHGSVLSGTNAGEFNSDSNPRLEPAHSGASTGETDTCNNPRPEPVPHNSTGRCQATDSNPPPGRVHKLPVVELV